MTFIISFDIDGVSGHFYEKNSLFDAIFTSRGSIVKVKSYGHRYGISSGMIELCQRVYQDPRILKVVCFSAGLFNRNEEFWIKLLKQSLSREKFREVIRNVQIFSRKDLSNPKTHVSTESHTKYQTPKGSGKKGLAPCLGEAFAKQIIHIDDYPDYIYPGEEGNVLITYKATAQHFMKASEVNEGADFEIAVNQASYIAGMIFSSMNAAVEESLPISTVLFQKQYVPQEKDTFKPVYSELHEKRETYLEGLKELCEINPDLSLGKEVSQDVNPLIATLQECHFAFKNFWGSRSYQAACGVLDRMLDSIERKSGRWRVTSKIVTVAVLPLIKEACTPQVPEEVALPLLSRILEIPRDSKRKSCAEVFLSSVPDKLRSLSLSEIIKTLWYEMQRDNALSVLKKWGEQVKTFHDFVQFELVLKFICSVPLKQEVQKAFFLTVQEICNRKVRLLCLEHLEEVTFDSYAKFLVIVSHARTLLQEKRVEDALKMTERAIDQLIIHEQITKSISIEAFENFRDCLAEFNQAGVSDRQWKILILKIKKSPVKTLKNLLLFHCFGFLKDVYKFTHLHELLSGSTSLPEFACSYMQINLLAILDKEIDSKDGFIREQTADFLNYLLGDFCVHWTYGPCETNIKFCNAFDFMFPAIQHFLSSLPISPKKAYYLANLARTYWKGNQKSQSLEILAEIWKDASSAGADKPIIQSIWLSLLYFQCKSYDSFQDLGKIEAHCEATLAYFPRVFVNARTHDALIMEGSFQEDVNLSCLLESVFLASRAIVFWGQGKYDNAFQALKQLSDKAVEPVSRAELEHFAVCDMLRLSLPDSLGSTFHNIISSFSLIELKMDALITMQRFLDQDSSLYAVSQIELAISFWRVKSYKESMQLLRAEIDKTNFYKVSDFEKILKLGEGLKFIFKNGIPVEHAEDVYMNLLYYLKDERVYRVVEDCLKSLDLKDVEVLKVFLEQIESSNDSNFFKKIRVICGSLIKKFWDLELYDYSLYALAEFIRINKFLSNQMIDGSAFAKLVEHLCKMRGSEEMNEKLFELISKNISESDLNNVLRFFPHKKASKENANAFNSASL